MIIRKIGAAHDSIAVRQNKRTLTTDLSKMGKVAKKQAIKKHVVYRQRGYKGYVS